MVTWVHIGHAKCTCIREYVNPNLTSQALKSGCFHSWFQRRASFTLEPVSLLTMKPCAVYLMQQILILVHYDLLCTLCVLHPLHRIEYWLEWNFKTAPSNFILRQWLSITLNIKLKTFLFKLHDCLTHTHPASLKDSSPHGNRFPICRSSIKRFPDNKINKEIKNTLERRMEREKWQTGLGLWVLQHWCINICTHWVYHIERSCLLYRLHVVTYSYDSSANLTQLRYFLIVLLALLLSFLCVRAGTSNCG